MRKLRKLSPFVMLLLLVLVSLSSSCDRRNPPLIIPEIPSPPPPSEQRIITKAVATPDTIYADNNITYSTIAITVKDGEGFAASNQVVQFKTDLGRIITNVATDSSGVAQTLFWDDGDIGTATIHAVVRNYHDSIADSIVSADTTLVSVEIVDVPPIQSVSLEFPTPSSIGPQPLTVTQTIQVRARAINNLDNDVPNNTLITFTTNRGGFVDNEGNVMGDSLVVKTVNGRATVSLTAGTIAGTGTVRARLADKSASRDIIVSPGRPSNLELKSFVKVGEEMVEADTSSVGSPNQIFMQAKLTDMHNNLCPTKPVKFTTDLGTFINTTQEVTLNTDVNGTAQVRFTPGLEAGAANITAFANGDTLFSNLIFNISSDEVHSIQWTQEEQITLAVANTGGSSSAILRVKLKDINGNLIDTPQNVWFRITNNNPPAGANLNNQPASDSILVVSNGGEAQISVNSGTVSGVLSVQASWLNEEGTKYVFASKPNIIIQAGPPNTVVPFIGGFNTATNMGGGLWRVIAGAVVKDQWGNPVERGTAVRFFLPTDTYNCQIVAESSVGNVSINGDSLAGVAYTTLVYAGVYTNEPLVIRVETISGGVSIFGQATVILPLQDPRFEMQAVPGLLNFGDVDGVPNPLSKNALIYAQLNDSQGSAINNAKIMLVSTRGELIWTIGTNNTPDDPAWQITTDATGLAQGEIRYYGVEIPLPDPLTQTPGQANGAIVGRILGTNVFAETSVNLYRYPQPNAPF